MFNTLAAKQMLIRYKGNAPHAEFTKLQTDFDAIGFPSQGGIRNITIVNGATNGALQPPAGNFNPGNEIASITFVTGLLNVFAKVRTNGASTSTEVASLKVLSGLVPLIDRKKSHSFDALNYDIAPGGWKDNGKLGDVSGSFVAGTVIDLFNLARWFPGRSIETHGRDKFAFVPLFSALAVNGARNTQTLINRSVSSTQSAGATPFVKVYGQSATATQHTDFTGEMLNIWRAMLNQELGLPSTQSTACRVGAVTPSTPPVPSFNADYWYACQSKAEKMYLRTPDAVANLYGYTWSVTGPSSFSVGGASFTFPTGKPAGVYTVTLTRRYSSTSGVTSTLSSASSHAFTVYSDSHQTYGCGGGTPSNPGTPGGPAPFQAAGGGGVPEVGFAADLEIASVTPNPAREVLYVRYASDEPTDVTLTVRSIDGAAVVVATAMPATLGSGIEETFVLDLAGVTSGRYVVTVASGRGAAASRLITIAR